MIYSCYGIPAISNTISMLTNSLPAAVSFVVMWAKQRVCPHNSKFADIINLVFLGQCQSSWNQPFNHTVKFSRRRQVLVETMSVSVPVSTFPSFSSAAPSDGSPHLSSALRDIGSADFDAMRLA
jgi:hypothetical protein